MRKAGKWVAIKAIDLTCINAASIHNCLWARTLKRAFPRYAVTVGGGHTFDEVGFTLYPTKSTSESVVYAFGDKVRAEYNRIWNDTSRAIEFYVPAPREDGKNYVRRFRLRKKAA